MKALFFLFIISFTFNVSAQTPFMVCKPGGYSKEDIKNFLFDTDEYGNLILKQDTFVQNYANHYVRIVNNGYLKCKKNYSITTGDLAWVTDNSYVENHEMKPFMNSRKVGNEIEFFQDTFTGGLRIHEYDGCRVPTMKDSCANLAEFYLPDTRVVQNKRPSFVVGDDTAPNGGKSPNGSGDKKIKPETKKDTTWIPEVGPVVTSKTPPPTQGKAKSYQQEEYERQQQEKLANQNQESGDSLKIPGVPGMSFSLHDNSSMAVNINTGSGSISTNSGQYQPYPKDEDDDLVFDRKTRRYVRQSVIVVDDRPRSSFAATLFAGFGSCFGNYGGGSYYYPPSCNGVTGLTSSSAFPVNFNWQGRQVRKGMNGQFEAGGLGSATGPSVWPF